jgi:hypothetical protein
VRFERVVALEWLSGRRRPRIFLEAELDAWSKPIERAESEQDGKFHGLGAMAPCVEHGHRADGTRQNQPARHGPPLIPSTFDKIVTSCGEQPRRRGRPLKRSAVRNLVMRRFPDQWSDSQ